MRLFTTVGFANCPILLYSSHMKAVFPTLLKIILSLVLVLLILTAPSLFVNEGETRYMNLHAPIEVLEDFFTELGSEDFFIVMFGKTPRDLRSFIFEYTLVSLKHLLTGTIISLLMGISLGILIGVNKGSRSLGGLSLISAIPDFILVMLLQLISVMLFSTFGIRIGYINYSSQEGIAVLPVIIIVIISISYVIRTISLKMVTIATEDYIQYARAKGLSRRVIIFRHMLVAVLDQFRGDVIKLVSISIGSLFIVERMFNIPGLTRLLFSFGFNLQFTYSSGVSAYSVNFRIAAIAIILIACVSSLTYIVCYSIILLLKRMCAHEAIF